MTDPAYNVTLQMLRSTQRLSDALQGALNAMDKGRDAAQNMQAVVERMDSLNALFEALPMALGEEMAGVETSVRQSADARLRPDGGAGGRT